MPIYKAPVEDVNFLLNDVFQIDRYDNLPGFTDASADVRDAILGEARGAEAVDLLQEYEAKIAASERMVG